VDNKNKDAVAESDIVKLVRDAKQRSIPVAILVTRDETQLRQMDRENRWDRKDGIWMLRTTGAIVVRPIQPILMSDTAH
jgi:hypothetical protein